jgi:pimeloyl-ACP methyl ester carboxylesterase
MDAATEPRDASMRVRDGRTVAWTDWGDADGIPLLRVPGTPGCRWSVRADRAPWAERGLRVVTTERPGFGASSRLPGRRFREHADDLAEVLDHLGLDRVHLTGGSGAAPHELALCQYHPDRVVAATVVAGMAPFDDDEIDTMIPINAEVARLARAGRRDDVATVLAPHRDAMLSDPLGAFHSIMDTAPPEDLAVMADPTWQKGFARALLESLGAGLDGWVDEAMALDGLWDVEPSSVPTSVTWYHAAEDRNCPVAAARRLVAQLPDARFVEWTDAGHLTAYHLEGEILDELLARG